MWHKVTAPTLNLRSKPIVQPSTRLASLQQGQIVEEVGPSSAAGWIVVEATLGASVFRGHVNAKYLTPAQGSASAPVAIAHVPPAVHLQPAKGVRANKSAMAFPLSEPAMPPFRRPGAATPARIAALHTNIAWLSSPSSRRYSPEGGATYCNIYAYDYAYLAGVYLPRVWWMGKALTQIANGTIPPVSYGVTVSELNANSLYNWLSEWSDEYGWKRLGSPDAAQAAANSGEAVLVCARRKDLQKSGHIAAVVPEPAAPGGVSAVRTVGVVTSPLLSQAGSRNFSYEPNRFYLGNQFQAFGFWAHS